MDGEFGSSDAKSLQLLSLNGRSMKMKTDSQFQAKLNLAAGLYKKHLDNMAHIDDLSAQTTPENDLKFNKA